MAPTWVWILAMLLYWLSAWWLGVYTRRYDKPPDPR